MTEFCGPAQFSQNFLTKFFPKILKISSPLPTKFFSKTFHRFFRQFSCPIFSTKFPPNFFQDFFSSFAQEFPPKIFSPFFAMKFLPEFFSRNFSKISPTQFFTQLFPDEISADFPQFCRPTFPPKKNPPSPPTNFFIFEFFPIFSHAFSPRFSP